MTKEEFLLRELCWELANKGVHTERFTKLWMESGVNLDSCEMEIADKILQRSTVRVAHDHWPPLFLH